MTTKPRFDLWVADRVYLGNPFTLYLNGFTKPFIGACVMVSTNPHDASSYHTSPTLVGRVQANEEVAWQRLVDLYGPLIFSWGRRGGLSRYVGGWCSASKIKSAPTLEGGAWGHGWVALEGFFLLFRKRKTSLMIFVSRPCVVTW